MIYFNEDLEQKLKVDETIFLNKNYVYNFLSIFFLLRRSYLKFWLTSF